MSSSTTAPPPAAASNPIPEAQSTTSTTGANTSVPDFIATVKKLGIENTNIKTAAGVSLTDHQKVIVGSVLDLFEGKPSVAKLSLWSETATFADPLTNAKGRKQYAAQWYGLAAAFSKIERLGYEVKKGGKGVDPIEMDLETRYTVKGIGKEQVVGSLVRIWLGGENGEKEAEKGKIVKVEDRWNGNIPEGIFAKTLRNLNAVVVPAFVSVPKNEEEENAKKAK